MKTILYNLLFLTSISFAQTNTIDKLIVKNIDHYSEKPVHSILFYAENENFSYNEGFGLIDRVGDTISKNSPFKIASSTKLFISTIILQLQEKGKLKLSDKILPYLKDIEYLDLENIHILKDINYSQKITIKQLLSHRSGLADIFTDKEEAFFKLLAKNPSKQYSPKSIVALFHQFNLNRAPHFKPNNGWHYSDMNFLLLGLLIEQLDNTTLAQSIRNRILEPLKMKHTFLEYYEAPKRTSNQINQYVGTINFTNINTSFDWAGGGLVSTNSDLAIFIKALFNLKIINQASLDKMIDVKFTKKNESRYGLGVYEFNLNNNVYYGHFGFYGSFVGYCPKTKTTLSYSISQATPNFNPYQFISKLLKFAN